MEIDNLKLSDILETYRCIENPSEHDKENEKQLEEAISKYGDITVIDITMVNDYSPMRGRKLKEV